MSGFAQPATAASSIFGSAPWGDFTMDATAQTTPPRPPLTNGTAVQSITPATVSGGQAGITYGYGANCDVFFHNLTINAGCAFFSQGDRLFVAGTLTLNGLIDFGNLSSMSAAGTTPPGGVGNPASDPLGGQAVSAATGTGAGAAGVLPTAGAGAAGGTVRLGGQSGAGGAGGSAQGTAGGARVNVPATLPESVSGGVFSGAVGAALAYPFNPAGLGQILGAGSGGNGAGDATNNGGAGGAGGGVVVVVARNIIGTGTIWSSGGNGGTPPVAGGGLGTGGGGGGGGGVVVVITQSAVWGGSSYSIPGITVAAPGGLGGSAAGTGAAGGNGTGGSIIIMPG